MASNYPTSLDSFTDPLSNSPLNSPSHAGQHQDLNNSVEQLEAKLGTGASPAASATANKVLVANGSGGSSWAAVPEYALQTGLVYITSASATSGTVLNVNSCFTSTHASYILVITGVPTSGAYGIDLRMRTSGTDTQTGYFWGMSRVDIAASAISVQVGNNSSVFATGAIAGTAGRAAAIVQIIDPQLAQYTSFMSQATDNRGSASYAGLYSSGQLTNTTQYDGFTLMFGAGGGTISNLQVKVYGYR